MQEKREDIDSFKSAIFKHYSRILGAKEKKMYIEYVKRLMLALAPYARNSKQFQEAITEVGEGKIGGREEMTYTDADTLFMALSYVMIEGDLSPPVRVEGVLDAEAIELLYGDAAGEA